MEKARQLAETMRAGSSLMRISNAAEAIGYKTIGVNIPLKELFEVPLPCILHWNKNHFVILYKIKNNHEKKKINYG